MSIGMAQSDII